MIRIDENIVTSIRPIFYVIKSLLRIEVKITQLAVGVTVAWTTIDLPQLAIFTLFTLFARLFLIHLVSWLYISHKQKCG